MVLTARVNRKAIGLVALVSALASPVVSASPLFADLSTVSGSLAGGYTANVPTFGSLSLSFSTPALPSGFSDIQPAFLGGGAGPNFVLGQGNTLTISAPFLTSAIFELWDLDTVDGVTETATFNPGGTSLSGVGTNILNSIAFQQPVFSTRVFADGSGSITISAGTSDPGYAIGGIQINPTPAPATLALLALGLLGLRAVARRKG
jgi:hypothetical protein